jgi:mono/diheme cytochrome c family protein
MRVLHATDIRQIPLILRHGLFAGAGRAACVPDTPAGRAYVERIVADQGRRGWPMAAVAFEVAEAEVTPAEDPNGIGLALASRAPGLPPRLLDRVQAIGPQGRRIASSLEEWERGHALHWLDPARLDRRATLEVNAALRDGGPLPPGTFAAVRRALAARAGFRPVPVALVGLSTVLGLTAAFLLFAGRDGDRPAGTAAIYRQHCAGCHGDTGRGDGLQARLAFLKMPDLTDRSRMASLSDDYLYTVTAKGSAALGGTSAMPGWEQMLKPEEIHALVAYIRTFAAPRQPSR